MGKILLAVATAGAITLPMAAQAQGTLRGAAVGAGAAGPVGGIPGVDDRPRFRSYVRDRGTRS